MNTILKIMVFILLVVGLEVYAEDKPAVKERGAASVKFRRLLLSKPRRFSGVNREDNLNDIEVREIVAATHTIYPGAIVTIDAVKNGCPCEDGESCDAQVWVVLYEPGNTQGLMLSKISDRWTVGPVQKWWLEYDRLRTEKELLWRSTSTPVGRDDKAIEDEMKALRDRFPICFSEGDAGLSSESKS
ncbi:hypothetical protein [Microbulbifer pacificus]|uniref:Uncharacterized protein n=1 Tax=Microbulbifer pacificus TaxID=407164 RepID=A0AAU0N4N5_9GAMM|nr:hypothetical protein [Microbulbifer pacificus]WOX07234.1 hypothetical protein R5R33_08890 [Microbulbifer pacificus]